MLKSDWIAALKEMKRLRKIAVGNVEAAGKQQTELEFNIENYENKIKSFDTD